MEWNFARSHPPTLNKRPPPPGGEGRRLQSVCLVLLPLFRLVPVSFPWRATSPSIAVILLCIRPPTKEEKYNLGATIEEKVRKKQDSQHQVTSIPYH